MKKHNITLIETPYPNTLKEGEIYVDIDKLTGLIKAMKKRKGGKLVSLLAEEKPTDKQLLINEIHKNYGVQKG